MGKIIKEVAVQDFERWLNFKRIKDKKREDNKAQEEIIVDAIMDGVIVVSENCELIFKLPDPVFSNDGKPMLSELKFKPRIQVFELNAKLKGVKSDDADARVLAYIAAITGQNSGLLAKLYTEDYTICQSIVVYFL